MDAFSITSGTIREIDISPNIQSDSETEGDTMEERGKINILGTEYTIFTNVSEQEKPFMNGNDGATDFTTKEIFVAILNDGNPMNMQNMKVYEDRTIRHEIVHAFLFESGLDHNAQWARNEEIVDWIAIQSPKLFKIFVEMELKS